VITAAVLFSSSGSKKKPVAKSHAPVHAVSESEVPSVESAQFGDWISAPGNAEKFFK
jgi:hypothetical protein